MSYRFDQDPAYKAYIEIIRKQKAEKISKCFVCGSKDDVQVSADGYRVVFLCAKHRDEDIV